MAGEIKTRSSVQYEHGQGNFTWWYHDPKELPIGSSVLYTIDRSGTVAKDVPVSTGTCDMTAQGQITTRFSRMTERATISLPNKETLRVFNGSMAVSKDGEQKDYVMRVPEPELSAWNPANWSAISRASDHKKNGDNSPEHIRKVGQALKDGGISGCKDASGQLLMTPPQLIPLDIDNLTRAVMGRYVKDLSAR